MGKKKAVASVTQWFGCLNFEPVHNGRYEVEFMNRGKPIKIAKVKWQGDRWSFYKSMRPSGAMGDRWRGLAEKP